MNNGNGNSSTSSLNQGSGYNNFQNNFGNSNPQGGNAGRYNSPRAGGFPPSQGSWARHGSKASPPAAARHEKAPRTYRHHKLVLLALLLLVAFTVLFRAHEWFLHKARSSTLIPLSPPTRPLMGLMAVLTSFAISYTYWSVKNYGVQILESARCVSSLLGKAIYKAF
jgi:hypothetical protein